MIPAPFDYEVADSVDHAIEMLSAAGPDAKVLAGGHSLIPLMKLRFSRPSTLVDISRIGSLSYIREDGDRIAIGALTRHHDVHRSDVLEAACPMLSYAAGLIGDPQVRHKGTIGGAVAHGDPASDLPTVLLALDAQFVIRGPNNARRAIGAGDFFQGFLQTDMAPDEVLTEIRVPKLGPSSGWSYLKFTRRALDWAIVGVAALVRRTNGTVEEARITLGNMGTVPLRAAGSEGAMAGGDRSTIPNAAALAADGTSPPSDTNGGADYRRALAKVLVGRALEGALGT